jgi:hypothetical protein
VKEHVNWIAEPVAETRFVCGEDSMDETPSTMKPDAGQAHSPLNKVILPDEFLKTWFPTFLIRPPALVFPSNFRRYVDNEGKENVKNDAQPLALEMAMHKMRTLHDWYAQKFAKSEEKDSDVTWPICP